MIAEIRLMATPAGFEPATSAVTGRHANQLRYRAIFTGAKGFEPLLTNSESAVLPLNDTPI